MKRDNDNNARQEADEHLDPEAQAKQLVEAITRPYGDKDLSENLHRLLTVITDKNNGAYAEDVAFFARRHAFTYTRAFDEAVEGGSRHQQSKGSEPESAAPPPPEPAEEAEAPNLPLQRHEFGKRFAEKIVERCEFAEEIIQDVLIFCDTFNRDCGNNQVVLVDDLAEGAMQTAYAMGDYSNRHRREYTRRLREQQGAWDSQRRGGENDDDVKNVS